jgi:hypothetical protein
MTYDEWAPQYRKLVRTYNKTESGEQCASYFEALRDLRVVDVEPAVTEVIRKQEYWPVPAKIREQVEAAKASAYRERPVLPDYEPISDEKRAELLAVIRRAKEKIFGRSM